jgi:hypothetical protein
VRFMPRVVRRVICGVVGHQPITQKTKFRLTSGAQSQSLTTTQMIVVCSRCGRKRVDAPTPMGRVWV